MMLRNIYRFNALNKMGLTLDVRVFFYEFSFFTYKFVFNYVLHMLSLQWIPKMKGSRGHFKTLFSICIINISVMPGNPQELV